jgi:DNA-binding NtrC family response regulator
MRKKILVCDDEEGIRESLKLILEKDYDVVFAESGDDAIQKMKTSPTDMVILDIKMPRKDGLETLKEIKKVSPMANVIIATGYKSVDTAQEAMRLGASDYIVKPFDRETISKVVRKHLSVTVA